MCLVVDCLNTYKITKGKGVSLYEVPKIKIERKLGWQK